MDAFIDLFVEGPATGPDLGPGVAASILGGRSKRWVSNEAARAGG
jgi:hypothetical protein